MGKIAIWILVVIAVMLVLRLIAAHKRKAGADPTAAGSVGARRTDDKDEVRPGGSGGELMMSCAVCEIHLPASDAVFARGKVFCSPEHRDLEEARRENRQA